MSLKQSVEWELSGETEVLRGNLPQCRFINHKPQGTAMGSRRLTAWAGQCRSSPAFYRCGPVSSPGQVMWHLSWTQRHWAGFLRILRFPLAKHSTDCSTLVVIHHHPSSPGAGTIGHLVASVPLRLKKEKKKRLGNGTACQPAFGEDSVECLVWGDMQMSTSLPHKADLLIHNARGYLVVTRQHFCGSVAINTRTTQRCNSTSYRCAAKRTPTFNSRISVTMLCLLLVLYIHYLYHCSL
jgi:hypothetical protein